MNILTEHPKPSIKVGVLILKRLRAGFVPEWGEHIEDLARKQLQESIFDTFIPGEKIVDVISLRRALEECDKHDCQVLVALQPTTSDGRMAPVLGQTSKSPVVLWATSEKQEGSMISACSLVGTHAFAAALAQLKHPFELVYGMPGESKIATDLETAIYRSYAYTVVKGCSAGLVGYHAPGFIDMHVDPTSLHNNLDIELFHVGINEFNEAVHAVSDEAAMADVVNFNQYKIAREPEVSDTDMLLSSKYYLHMKELFKTMQLQALGVREWPEMSASHWPYLAMARLASEGYAIACEGDTDGALSCLIGTASGCGACYLSDWLEHDEHHITLWHGGAAPFQLCKGIDDDVPPEITRFFNNRRPAVVDATLKIGMPITLFRLWHYDGKYLFTAIEGETVKPKRHLMGTNGVGCFPDINIDEYFRKMINKGLPHHPVVCEGHVKKHLYNLMSNLKIECMD